MISISLVQEVLDAVSTIGVVAAVANIAPVEHPTAVRAVVVTAGDAIVGVTDFVQRRTGSTGAVVVRYTRRLGRRQDVAVFTLPAPVIHEASPDIV